MNARFAYDGHRAKFLHDSVDRTLGQIENRIRYLSAIVPNTGAIPSRLEDARDTVAEVAADLHDLVDQRTETEVVL